MAAGKCGTHEGEAIDSLKRIAKLVQCFQVNAATNVSPKVNKKFDTLDQQLSHGHLAELRHVHFIRAICDTTKACRGKYFRYQGILTHTRAAKHLHGTIRNILAHLRTDYLNHGNIGSRCFQPALIHQLSGLHDQ